ncbi:hypothetical protein [Alishewanella jeotgali]|uniref:Uncharacterized protein n=1 Tax=Alishewanella jeotgali KCTC 22429 TaxID=1129374 RepID=H3Z9R1_9ALTE|nr:hypothetical protein [Alishewanella jeotgali]EHR42585.1 hypothetical protein AJE_00310 [Alishewanella jeotgali KCTC 22429]
MLDKIKPWACSFSGCDGGNPEADTWLCGIEWGLEPDAADEYYTRLKQQMQAGAVKVTKTNFDWRHSISYPYGVRFAKLYQAINQQPVQSYRSVAELSGEQLFKLNLYPIAFNSTADDLWHQYRFDEATSFPSKLLFNNWCFFNRFPFYAALRKQYQPKLIICTGVNYLKDFLMFFAGSDGVRTIESEVISINATEKRTLYWSKVDNTLLVVLPFFSGRFGLNSDALLQAFGSRIAQLKAEIKQV